jgi:hypothetical protein
MQQDLEEEKNKAVIQNLAEKVENYEADLKKKDFTIQDLEMMVKEHEGALEKKDFVIQTMEGSLAEVQTENNSLKNELLQQSEKFEQEKKYLEASLKTEVDKNSNLQKSFKELQEKCLSFGSRCVQRLKDVFHSVGASSAKFTPWADNQPSTLEYIEGKVDALDEVIGGHADFCALVASLGTATAFLKAGCMHGNIVNRPNFSLSASDLINIPSLARSIGNRFMTQIWVNGGRKMAGDEARSHLKPVRNLLLLLLPSPWNLHLSYFAVWYTQDDEAGEWRSWSSTKPSLKLDSCLQSIFLQKFWRNFCNIVMEQLM